MVTSEKIYVFSFQTYFTGQADCWKTLECTIDAFTTGKFIYHFRNEKRTGAELFPQLFLGSLLLTRCSAISQYFSLSLLTVPEASAKVNSAQFPSPDESWNSSILDKGA